MAADEDYLYAAVADSEGSWMSGSNPGEPKPGLNKLSIKTGEIIWPQ